MARHLFIVSQHHPGLFDYLRTRFSSEENVEIILNRRQGERRRAEGTVDRDRRVEDRRSRPHVDAGLRANSFEILTLP